MGAAVLAGVPLKGSVRGPIRGFGIEGLGFRVWGVFGMIRLLGRVSFKEQRASAQAFEWSLKDRSQVWEHIAYSAMCVGQRGV